MYTYSHSDLSFLNFADKKELRGILRRGNAQGKIGKTEFQYDCTGAMLSVRVKIAGRVCMKQ
jgi:hypothetical protein